MHQGVCELALQATSLTAVAGARTSFVLDNGLLRVRSIPHLLLEAVRDEEGGSLARGWLTLGAEVDLAVPMLADPYASDFLPWDGDGEQRQPQLLHVVAAAATGGARRPLPRSPSAFRTIVPIRWRAMPRRGKSSRTMTHAAVSTSTIVVALSRRPSDGDCSTSLGASDHLGLALYAEARSDERLPRASALDIDGLVFTHRLDRTDLLLLPGFLNERVGDTEPAMSSLSSATRPLGDGGPQRLSVELRGRGPARIPASSPKHLPPRSTRRRSGASSAYRSGSRLRSSSTA